MGIRVPCHLLVSVHCVSSTPKSTQHLPGDFRALCAWSAGKLYGVRDVLFQQNWAAAHSAKPHTKWCTDREITGLLCITALLFIQSGILSRNPTWPKNTDKLKTNIKASWASVAPQHVTSMPCCGDALIRGKGAPAMNWLDKWTEFQTEDILYWKPCFDWS